MRRFLLILALGCNDNNDGDDDGDDEPVDTDTDTTPPDTDTDLPTLPTPTVPTTAPEGWLRIRVDRPSASPDASGRLEGATVISSGALASTDNWGLAEIVNASPGPHPVEVRARGIPLLYSRVLQQPEITTSVWIEARDTLVWTPDATDGGTFVDGKLTLELPPAALLDPGGLPVVGPVDVGVLAVEPDSAAVLPPLVGTDEATSWLGFAAGYVRFTANQQDLTLNNQASLTLPVFVPPGVVWDPLVLPAVQRYDVVTGQWVDAGVALSATATTVTIAVGSSGWWMVGELRNEHCMTGRILETNPVAGAFVRVGSPDALVHGAGASMADGTFCACGPIATDLHLDTWALRPPADELVVPRTAVPALGAPESTCAAGATAVGDLTALLVPLACTSGMVAPANPGCFVDYGVYEGQSDKLYDDRIVVGEDADPSFCLTVPADLGDGGILIDGSFAAYVPVDRTCSMGLCADIGVLAATCP